MTSIELLIGTSNLGKVNEIKRVLNGLPLTLRLISDFPTLTQPDECASTYAGNAIIKAQSYALQTGHWTLADDSGLEVAALGGLPGVRSARFGGDGLSDADRTILLLSKLAQVPDDERSAAFVCAMAIARPTDEAKPTAEVEPTTDAKLTSEVVNLAHGRCEGRITRAQSGDEGFGYDPVFIPSGYEVTFGEMPFLLKNTLSHRGKALATTRGFLERLLI